MGKKSKGDYVNYEKMYGLDNIYQPQHTHEDDTEWDQRDIDAKDAIVGGHRANNWDLRETFNEMQDPEVRRYMKEQGFKNVDRMVNRDNLPGDQWMGKLAEWGRKQGIHNGKDFDVGDLGAVTRSFLGEVNDFKGQRMDDKYASQKSLDEMKDKLLNKDKHQETADVTELSPDLSQAQEEMNNYSTNYLTNAGDQLTGVANADDIPSAEFDNEVSVNEANPDADNAEGGNAYKNDYAFDVKNGLKLSGKPTRGPGSVA